jgi:hypothetical protein
MLTAWVPLIAVIVGLLLWALGTRPILVRIGEIMFACGFLVTMMAFASTTVTLLHK